MRKTAEHRDKTYKSANGIIKNGFVGGIIILTVSNLLVKVTGLLFKIPMNYIMGDTGMGYYNSAYSIYTLFYMLSTSGLPVAISVTVSEKRAQGKIGSAKKVFHLALAVFAAIGLLAFALMFFASGKLALLISSELSAMSIAARRTDYTFCLCLRRIQRIFPRLRQHDANGGVTAYRGNGKAAYRNSLALSTQYVWERRFTLWRHTRCSDLRQARLSVCSTLS